MDARISNVHAHRQRDKGYWWQKLLVRWFMDEGGKWHFTITWQRIQTACHQNINSTSIKRWGKKCPNETNNFFLELRRRAVCHFIKVEKRQECPHKYNTNTRARAHTHTLITGNDHSKIQVQTSTMMSKISYAKANLKVILTSYVV